jgi:hypothetical protein
MYVPASAAAVRFFLRILGLRRAQREVAPARIELT